jgi:hypothetical protein
MNIQFIKNKLAFNIKNYLAITIGFLIIISINSNSSHLEIFNEFIYELNLNSFIIILNTFRFLTPFFILVLLLIITLINIKYFINQKYPLFLILLIFNFLFQLIVYKFNYLEFDIGYAQLAINCINLAILFSLSHIYDLKIFDKVFFYFTFFFLFIISIYFSINILLDALNTGLLYLYWTKELIPNGQFIGQPNPRVTGLSKILILYFVFHFFIFYQIHKNSMKKIFNYLILFICIFFIYGMQTRGGLIGIFLFSFFYLIFIKEKLFNKLKKIILIIIIPILFYEVVMQPSLRLNNHSKETETTLAEADNLNNHSKATTSAEAEAENYNRYYNKENGLLLHSSGRVDLWKLGIDEIKKKVIIFGFGPQGDRQIFEDIKVNSSLKNLKAIKWSTNISNGLLYSYLSGGLVSLILISAIYILIIKEIVLAIFINSIFRKNSKKEIVSIFCLIYLCFRSIFENSFTLFSTDYILLVITFYNLYQFNLNSRIKFVKK